jgi:hypothetical protein
MTRIRCGIRMQYAVSPGVIDRVPGNNEAVGERVVARRHRRRLVRGVVGIVNHVVKNAVAGADNQNGIAGAESDSAVPEDIVPAIQHNARIVDAEEGRASVRGQSVVRHILGVQSIEYEVLALGIGGNGSREQVESLNGNKGASTQVEGDQAPLGFHQMLRRVAARRRPEIKCGAIEKPFSGRIKLT